MSSAAGPLSAVDGVIEINQAKALAGGVTPGDAPGFPVIIDQPGSYRLTGNLTVSGVEDDVIDVRSPNVTIDLNGFAIVGPLSCVYSAGTLNCTPDPSTSAFGDGIKARRGDLAVRNGVIRGMGRMGIVNFGAPDPYTVNVDNVRLLENGWSGIDLNVTAEVSISVSVRIEVNYRYFRFTVTDRRDPGPANGVQLTEFDIYHNGVQLNGATARLNANTVTNHGFLVGDGRINATLVNSASGEVHADPGRRLVLTATANTNAPSNIAGASNLAGVLTRAYDHAAARHITQAASTQKNGIAVIQCLVPLIRY